MTKNRRRCRSYPVNKFFDPATGKVMRINNTPWHLKNIEGEAGFFLKMDMTMQEMPKATFQATAARSKQYDFSNVQQQIDSFMKEVQSENTSNTTA